MNTELANKLSKYVEDNIGDFHKARIEKLKKMNLSILLKRKNPYLYKAKNVVTASAMVESLASAYMSSAEESIFGNWLEGLAIYVCEIIYGGYKSSAEGMDMEFDRDGIHYFVSIKSGPSWSNSSSMKALKADFVRAVNIFNTSRTPVPTMCIEGCCYGNDNKGYKNSIHLKYCGEKFWSLISGEPNLFVDIIEPLGYKAKEKNDEYYKDYGSMINKLTMQFIKDYCDSEGNIDWEKVVRLNAAVKIKK